FLVAWRTNHTWIHRSGGGLRGCKGAGVFCPPRRFRLVSCDWEVGDNRDVPTYHRRVDEVKVGEADPVMRALRNTFSDSLASRQLASPRGSLRWVIHATF